MRLKPIKYVKEYEQKVIIERPWMSIPIGIEYLLKKQPNIQNREFVLIISNAFASWGGLLEIEAKSK